MTRTPNGTVSPGTTTPVPTLPAVPPQPAPAGAAPPPQARRTAFAEGVDRLRRAATTEPGRLRVIGAVLAALARAMRRTYLRTNRVLNHGLVAATAATTVGLLWFTIGHALARSGLDDSYDHGVRSLDVLHGARIASLKARGNENLTRMARGAETTKAGDETFADDLVRRVNRILLDFREDTTDGWQDAYTEWLSATLGDDSSGSRPPVPEYLRES